MIRDFGHSVPGAARRPLRARPGPARGRAPLLVLGLGNDILTDDAVGLDIALEARRLLEREPAIEVSVSMEMGLALLDEITGREALIVIDSLHTREDRPGTLHILHPRELGALRGGSPHFLGLGETLELGRRLGLHMPALLEVYAVAVDDPFVLGEKLTENVAAAVAPVAARVARRARMIARTLQRQARRDASL